MEFTGDGYGLGFVSAIAPVIGRTAARFPCEGHPGLFPGYAIVGGEVVVFQAPDDKDFESPGLPKIFNTGRLIRELPLGY
jgi:hypothetical protein